MVRVTTCFKTLAVVLKHGDSASLSDVNSASGGNWKEHSSSTVSSFYQKHHLMAIVMKIFLM